MKTRREIVIEAQRLEEAGRRFVDETRRFGDRPHLADAVTVLFAFPGSQFSSHVVGGGNEAGEAIHVQCLRRIEAAIVGDDIEYRLLQDEIERDSSGAVVRETDSLLMLTSDSAVEVLEEGYELWEQDRLSESLAPFMERAEAGEFVHSVEPQVVEEIEAIVSPDGLLPASRLHTRLDIVKVLDGRLEPDEFINGVIARHRSCEGMADMLSERCGERILMDQP